MSVIRALSLIIVALALFAVPAYAETPATVVIPSQSTAAGGAAIKPYETFVTIQNYSLQSSGEPGNAISNVHLEITFPNGRKYTLPEGGQDWPIGKGQMQPINLTYKIPFKFIQKDGFSFIVQIVRKGTDLLPCQFKVEQLSQFNRSYVCHTDIGWQQAQKLSEDQIDREAVQVRVSTDIKENLAGRAEGASLADKIQEIPTKFIAIE